MPEERRGLSSDKLTEGRRGWRLALGLATQTPQASWKATIPIGEESRLGAEPRGPR